MDPMGNLYFYNEGTMQTTRQHPMDGCYTTYYGPTYYGPTYHGLPAMALLTMAIVPIRSTYHGPTTYIRWPTYYGSTYYGRYYQSLYRKLRLQQKQGDGGGGRRPSMAAGAGRRN